MQEKHPMRNVHKLTWAKRFSINKVIFAQISICSLKAFSLLLLNLSALKATLLSRLWCRRKGLPLRFWHCPLLLVGKFFNKIMNQLKKKKKKRKQIVIFFNRINHDSFEKPTSQKIWIAQMENIFIPNFKVKSLC